MAIELCETACLSALFFKKRCQMGSMVLTDEQLSFYKHQGYIFLSNYFSHTETEILKAQIPKLIQNDKIGRVLEKSGETVRALHGSHTRNSVLNNLTKLPRLIEPAMQILESQVYVYQFKINIKAAFSGDVWPWHQDFIFWAEEDGMLAPRAINILIFLDEVNEFNGPLFLIPGSHHEGKIQVQPQGKGWEANVKADLKYVVPNLIVAELVKKQSIVAPKGAAGSVLFFHPNCIHGSTNNISPFSRNVAIITYNSVENVPLKTENQRPEFMVNRDCKSIEALSNDILVKVQAVTENE